MMGSRQSARPTTQQLQINIYAPQPARAIEV